MQSKRSWLREPLLHFALLGGGLFLLDANLRGGETLASESEIVVPEGRVENLVALFVKTWQRVPTPEEVRGLVQDHVLEEALCREALELGLDRDDTVIRRRLRQKMEFLVEDVAELAEPSEADLKAWLAEHPDDYEVGGKVSLRQLYFGPGTAEDSAYEEARRALARLAGNTEADPRELGEATLLAYEHEAVGLDRLGAIFGPDFAQAIAPFEVGRWSGPVESAYGVHAVIVDGREPGRVPELAEVRDAVERDWRFAERREARARFNEELLERFQIRIEWPQDLAEAGIERGPEQ